MGLDKLFDIRDALQWEAARMKRQSLSPGMRERLLDVASAVNRAIPSTYTPSGRVQQRALERAEDGVEASAMGYEKRLDWLSDLRATLRRESSSTASTTRRQALRDAAGVISRALPVSMYDRTSRVRSGAPLAPRAPRARRVR